MKIIITNSGYRGNGIYVGRPSPYGNPFPTKKSKFSSVIYSHKESLYRFLHYIPNINFSPLIDTLSNNEVLTMDCWCINTAYSPYNLLSLEKKIITLDIDCHAEILAYFILYSLQLQKSVPDVLARLLRLIKIENTNKGGDCYDRLKRMD